MFYIRPLNFYKRDRAVFKAARENTLSSRKLLEIEYGEFPLKGVDTAQADERPIALRGYFADRKATVLAKILRSALTLGYVSVRELKKGETFDRSIYYNQLLHSPLGQGASIALNHGRIARGLYFLTFGAGSVAKALAATLALAKNMWFAGLLLLTHARGVFITQILTLPFRASTDTIGHEGIHILQAQQRADLDAAEAALKAGYEKNDAELKARIVRGDDNKYEENKAVYDQMDQDYAAYRAQREILRHTFNPLTSGLCESLMSYVPKTLKPIAVAEQALTYSLLRYLRNDAEIQARLHTILAQGYRNRWHQMPASKHELWAALISCGLNAPASIRKELAQAMAQTGSVFYQTGSRAAFNRAALKCTSPHAAEINAAQGSLLCRKNREAFWQDVLPCLYGHLLELYGDHQGRSRMGIAVDNRLRTYAEILGAEKGRIVRLSDVMQQLRAFTAGNPTQDERILFHSFAKEVQTIDNVLDREEVYVRVDVNKPTRDVYVDAADLVGDTTSYANILVQSTARGKLDIFSKCKDYSADVANGNLKPGQYKPRSTVQTMLGLGL